MTRLPERIFYSCDEIVKRWGIPTSDLHQYLLHGQLQASVWLPTMSVYDIAESVDNGRILLSKQMRHWHGYTHLYAHDCRAVLRNGKSYVRDFINPETGGRLSIAEGMPAVRVTDGDLVILKTEKQRFERKYDFGTCTVQIMGRAGRPKPQEPAMFDPTFRKVWFAGTLHHFGAIQASVLAQLYEAAKNGAAWQNGKKLLETAGSQSFTMQNVFKSNPHWRKFIESDGRGSYRLQEKFLSSITAP